LIPGNGDVIEPDYDVAAIAPAGSSHWPPRARFWKAPLSMPAASWSARLNIAADICIYTNRNLVIEELKRTQGAGV